jgi:hypothetical protein
MVVIEGNTSAAGSIQGLMVKASECLKNWRDRGLIQQLEEEDAI